MGSFVAMKCLTEFYLFHRFCVSAKQIPSQLAPFTFHRPVRRNGLFVWEGIPRTHAVSCIMLGFGQCITHVYCRNCRKKKRKRDESSSNSDSSLSDDNSSSNSEREWHHIQVVLTQQMTCVWFDGSHAEAAFLYQPLVFKAQMTTALVNCLL